MEEKIVRDIPVDNLYKNMEFFNLSQLDKKIMDMNWLLEREDLEQQNWLN